LRAGVAVAGSAAAVRDRERAGVDDVAADLRPVVVLVGLAAA
jgi:hypothetical protein